MRKPRLYKSRDPEAVKQALLDAVGAILKENGHQGLGVNRVSLRAHINKGLIYWYYTSYNHLVKTYIKGKDFWRPIFEKFQLREPPKEEELPGYITAIFQEQFQCFFGDKEMQKLILWQVSEPNPLLKEVSDERELEGAKIMALTDPHFKDSEIDFRSVVGLVLGGIYNMVWHASNNKSTVIGIDINNERDREKFRKAIGHVITAVWKLAEKV
ncbi:MAG: TetR/AcrR family transcriptional regulator [Candidatus Pedobacter colombiensis]|uniref:TetR/AcrR family transcriptional regulator n=1 Tax=Candidatus Pedobacter colombiensis TaxID=3121371 RepID=A0AAJ5W9G0_9SPHI|nr:TetR/AcrR family transcriptional regulator [Pedobacter sp.]WEK20421.1 MAG: TetR/AcrR family transcriptional regulator [Pedobacter sp.]